MPSLFSKRSRSLSTTRPMAPASSSAHLAAAQAFLSSQPSNSNLSASAAATALRTMSPPPTAVDQVQTKRMLTRQTSNTSVGSATRGRSRGTVQRRPSAGSMTERTFRSPSPGQQASASSPVTGNGRGAPPVPSVPQAYSEDVPPLPSKFHRRSASMEAPPPRVSSPPLRVGSPPLTRPAGRGQNVNRAPVASSAATAAARRSANPPPPPELQRSDSQDSRNSINFSYPRGSRPSSPPPKSPLATSNEATASPATNGISAAEAARIQNDLIQTAAKPVKKKKSRIDPSMAEGSHLQSGTMGAKPTVTPLGPLPPDYKPPEPTEPAKKPKKKAVLSGQSSHFPDSQQYVTAEGTTSDSDNAESPRDKRALRGAGVLMKHPSVVREDWEGEQEEKKGSPVEASASKSTRDTSTDATKTTPLRKTLPEANMSRKIEDPPVMPRQSSSIHSAVTAAPTNIQEQSPALVPSTGDISGARKASVSPSRSTRFSDRLASDMVSGRKHEPLGRSVSPAKSALKHSAPASDTSPTDPRFPGRRGSSVTPSETSDVSADGTSGKRKSVRVSFDAGADTRDSVSETRSSKESGKKSWFGHGKGKGSNLGSIDADEDLEGGMKPRPALPSFGSVRRGDRSVSPNAPVTRTTAQANVADKSSSSSETSSIADPPTMDTSISSDHALGGLLSREAPKGQGSSSNRKLNDPLPPTVTSVEGTGYESDTDSVYSDGEKPMHAAQSASQQLGRAIGDEDYSQIYKDEIPVIAVQPATPGIDEKQLGKEWAMDLPGGFPGSAASSEVSVADANGKQSASSIPARELTGLGFTGNTDDNSSPDMQDTSANSSPQPLMTITEEDSDDSSLYSDAAEDLADLEGDGFGSINAIVESPMVAHSSKQKITSPAESPLVDVAQRRSAESQKTSSWDNAQAHWSGLAQRSRDTKQQPSTPDGKTNVSQSSTVVEARPKADISNTPITPVGNTSNTKPATVAALKSQPTPSTHTRGAPQSPASPVVATKQAVHTKTQGHLRSSMRGEPEPIVASLRTRPASYAGPASTPRAALQKKHIPPAPVPAPVVAPRGPSRRFSNDSDSDSSFKKARRNKRPADGKYTMKRSMRNGPSTQEQPTAPAGRKGVRSLSPPSDRRPTSPMGMKAFRTTMRNSSDLAVPTLRGQPEGKRSSSLFSRNRTAKSPPRSSAAVTSMSSKIKSRFADSDDEDEPRPTHYKSRFENSSDEDEPKDLRPVRGIPRRKDEGDSTDLDDSSDDQGRKSKTVPAKNLTIAPPPPSQAIASPPVSPTTAKKRGLWSRLRGKKKEEEAEPVSSQSVAPAEAKKDEAEASKEEARNAKQLGFGSAAEKEAMIEQTRLKLEAAKERPQSPIERPSSPPGRLQRRITPQRVFSDSWAPPKMPAAVDDRPQTSGGVDGGNRPAIGSRQPTTTSEAVNGDGAVYGKSGKKKKFGFLRKAFGLTD